MGQRLKPNVHIFGHTHFGWDQQIDDIRYISAPLGMPQERARRLRSVAVGNFPMAFVHQSYPGQPAEPLLIWDAENGFPEQYPAAWSGFYGEYKREPGKTDWLDDQG